MADLQQARAAKSRLRSELTGHDGVRGVGLAAAEDGYCLQVNVARPADGADLPGDVDGVRVRVRVVGPVRARS